LVGGSRGWASRQSLILVLIGFRMRIQDHFSISGWLLHIDVETILSIWVKCLRWFQRRCAAANAQVLRLSERFLIWPCNVSGFRKLFLNWLWWSSTLYACVRFNYQWTIVLLWESVVSWPWRFGVAGANPSNFSHTDLSRETMAHGSRRRRHRSEYSSPKHSLAFRQCRGLVNTIRSTLDSWFCLLQTRIR